MSQTAITTLFLWDFDNTIVLDNTDLIVFERLSPEILFQLRQAPHDKTLGWTQLVDRGLHDLFTAGKSSTQILEAASSASLPLETARVLRSIASHPSAQSAILSDANTLFIGACLKKNELDASNCFQAGIFTNPATVDDNDRIRVSPFIPADQPERQHGCRRCAKNMCKGTLLDMLSSTYEPESIVYVGDGSNDYCPAKRIGNNGYVLARAGYSLANKLEAGPVKATVRQWENAQQLEQLITALL